MSVQPGLVIPVAGTGGSSLLNFSPIDELLSKALSDSVACMFSSKIPIPFSNIEIKSVPQDTHPIPAKWHEDVTIDDEGVFAHDGATSASVATSSRQSSALQSVEPSAVNPSSRWSGLKFFESALMRLGLDKEGLVRLLESDSHILGHFGRDMDVLVRTKKSIKSELKDYDTAFRDETGHEPARTDKEPMRLLYTLYRKLRDMIARLESSSLPAQPSVASPQIVVGGASRSDMEAKLETLYQEKQAIRHILQEYQARFMAEQGRRIKYHRDIVSVDREYRQYKVVKEEIGKLESQLGRTSTINKNSNDLFN